jgi:hypothetical protein
MSNTSPFSLANRKQFADMLADRPNSLRQRARERFNAKRHELYESLLREYADKKGAPTIMRQIVSAKEEIELLKSGLNRLGFDLDYEDDLRLHGGSSNPIDKLIDKRIEKELGVYADIDARFDSVAMAMMTVATLEDAQKLLKSVSDV